MHPFTALPHVAPPLMHSRKLPGVIGRITSGMPADSELREHLLDTAAHMRLITMGLILLLVLRFSPRGLIPER